MAKNKVRVDVEVTDKGSLKQVSKNAKEAAAGLDKTAKSAGTADRNLKGAAQASSNSTKNFSKMAQGIEGGLVPAYATLAANIFAVTAAFSFFQRAAQVRQLEQGLSAMGSASGLALKTLSEGLLEATGNALSFEEAMRSTVMVTSAGLDPKLVDDFGKVAKDASIALGRDTADSLARLSRGVTKLEPELLDELGIFVRLDEASGDYARSIGKSANELTNFEKRQAFANAVLEQGREKFSAIGDSVDSNPYDRLAASFQNLTKEFGNILDLGGAVSGIVGLLADNSMLLVGSILALSGSITGQLIDSAAEASASLKKLAQEDMEAFKQKSATLFSGKLFSSSTDVSLRTLNESLKDGRATTAEYANAVKFQETQVKAATTRLGKHNKKIKELKLSLVELNKDTDANEKAIRKTNKALQVQIGNQQRARNAIEQRGNAIKDINRLELMQEARIKAVAKAKALAALQEGNYTKALLYSRVAMRRSAKQTQVFIEQVSNGTRSIKLFGRELSFANKFVAKFKTGLVTTVPALAKFATGVKLAGAALLQAIPIIGQVIAVAMLLWEGLTALFDMFRSDASKQLEENTNNLTEAQKEFSKSLGEVDKFLGGQASKIFKLSDAYSNVANTTSQFLDKYRELGDLPLAEDARRDALANFIKQSKKLSSEYKGSFDDISSMEAFIEGTNKSATSVKGLISTFKEAGPNISNYLNSLAPKTKYSEIRASLSDMSKALTSLNNTDLEPSEKFRILSENLDESKARLLGVSKAYGDLGKAEKSRQDIQKRLQDIGKEQDALRGDNSVEADKRRAELVRERVALLTQQNVLEGDISAASETLSKEAQNRLKTFRELLNLVDHQNALNASNLSTTQSLLAAEKEKGVFSIDSLQKQIGLQNTIKALEISTLNNNLKLLKDQREKETNAEQQAVLDAQILVINSQIAQKQGEIVDGAETRLQIAERQYQIDKASLDAQKGLVSSQLNYVQSLKGNNLEAAAALTNSKLNAEIASKHNDIQLEASKLLEDQTLTESERENILNNIRALGFDILALENQKVTAIDTGLKIAQHNLKVKEHEQSLEKSIFGLKQKQAALADEQAQRDQSRLRLNFEKRMREADSSIPLGLGRIMYKDSREQEELALQRKMAESKLNAAIASVNLKREELRLEQAMAQLKMNLLKAQTKQTNQELGVEGVGANGLTSGQNALFAQLDAAQQNVFTMTGAGLTDTLALAREEFDNTISSLEKAKADLGDLAVLGNAFGESLETEMGSAFSSIIQGTMSVKDAFANMAQNILKRLADIIAEMLVMQAIKGSMSLFGFGNPVTSVATQATTSVAPLTVESFTKGMNLSLAGRGRYGGVFSAGSKVPGYATGGIAKGPQAGYPVELHGTEAVVPLPNGKEIPVQMKNGGGTNNVVVNVNVDNQGNATTTTESQTSQDAGKLGQMISQAVQKELQNQKRSGGILNPYGAS